MRKLKFLFLWTLSSDDSRVTAFECHPGRSLWRLIGSIAILALTLALVACGDDNSSFVNDDDSSSSSTPIEDLSSSVTLSGRSSGTVSSSSSVILSESEGSSSSSVDSIGSLSLQNDKPKSSSSSVIPDSVSSSSKTDSGTSAGMTSSRNTPSSSSEYVPFDHSKTHAASWEIGENRYKTFVDPRNGRSYYYITITSDYLGKSVTVMAENLNIGEMVLGADNQNDDTKIERYCYNNDTTKCDEFGGLYQWAEMMQLPSRCNTESCADLIQENHRGICPEGWRLFTWDDYVVVRGYEDKYNDGVKGLRSMYRFLGTNQSGFSLTGAGMRRTNGVFFDLEGGADWFFPSEFVDDKDARAYIGFLGSYSDSGSSQTTRDKKTFGFSVRCTKLE